MRLIDADNLRRRMLNGYDKITIDCAPTIDPNEAGGCYCRECCFGQKPHSADMQDGYVYCRQQSNYRELDSFCSEGEPGRRTMAECIYKTYDGYCAKHSDGIEYLEPCLEGPCDDETMPKPPKEDDHG